MDTPTDYGQNMPTREDVRIWAEREQIAAYLYRPETGATADAGRPCVVMAHGFSATRDDGLPGLAHVASLRPANRDGTAVDLMDPVPPAQLRRCPTSPSSSGLSVFCRRLPLCSSRAGS